MLPEVAKANNIELFKSGYKLSSAVENAALINIRVVSELSDLARLSLGPNCHNKFFTNNLGLLSLSWTSDPATIKREVGGVHIALQMFGSRSQSQQAEIGDGTKTVLILAGELLKKAEHLLIMGLHPREIRQGYELACQKALRELETLSSTTLPTPLTLPTLVLALKPVLAPKQFGSEDILAALVAEAALAVMPTGEKGFNVDNVRVAKIMGGSLSESKVVRGIVFAQESEGTIKHTTAAKVAVFTSALDIAQTETEGKMLFKNTDETLNFTCEEDKHLEKIIKEIADSGVKVIIAGSSVSDIALRYLNRHSIAVLKVLSKFELCRLCRVLNATPLERMGTPTPEEAGWVDVYETVELDGNRVTVLRQLIAGDPGFETSGKRADGKGEKTRTATIVLRGATANRLHELEHAIDDGVNLIRSLLRDRRLVPGAGATELELARRVEVYGGGMKGQKQHAVKRFAVALEVIPRTLAENPKRGREGDKVVSHHWGDFYTTEPFDGAGWDMDFEAEPPSNGTILADSNSPPYPILDSLVAKHCAIKLATEAAIMVLGIDSSIMNRQAGAGQRNWVINTPLRLTININTTPLSLFLRVIISMELLLLLAMIGYKTFFHF